MKTELADDQTPSVLQQTTIRTEQFEDISHEAREVELFGGHRDLGEEFEIVLDHLMDGSALQIHHRLLKRNADIFRRI